MDSIVFDKTGTLTVGRPEVTDIRPVLLSGVSQSDLLSLAAALERESTHPHCECNQCSSLLQRWARHIFLILNVPWIGNLPRPPVCQVCLMCKTYVLTPIGIERRKLVMRVQSRHCLL